MTKAPSFDGAFALFELISLCSTDHKTGVGAAVMWGIKASAGLEAHGSRNTYPKAAPQKTNPHRWTRLAREQCEAIISRYKAGEPSTALAIEFNVAKDTIINMLRGTTSSSGASRCRRIKWHKQSSNARAESRSRTLGRPRCQPGDRQSRVDRGRAGATNSIWPCLIDPGSAVGSGAAGCGLRA